MKQKFLHSDYCYSLSYHTHCDSCYIQHTSYYKYSAINEKGKSISSFLANLQLVTQLSVYLPFHQLTGSLLFPGNTEIKYNTINLQLVYRGAVWLSFCQ